MSVLVATAQLGIGSPYDEMIVQFGQTYVVDPALVKAVITKESSWNPRAYRPEVAIGDASYGLMQLLLRTAQGMQPGVTANDLFDPLVNINLGTRYLAGQLQVYGYPAGVSAYNAGHPITGNAQYVSDVDGYYAWFLANDPLFQAPPGGGGGGDSAPFPRRGADEWRGRRRHT